MTAWLCRIPTLQTNNVFYSCLVGGGLMNVATSYEGGGRKAPQPVYTTNIHLLLLRGDAYGGASPVDSYTIHERSDVTCTNMTFLVL